MKKVLSIDIDYCFPAVEEWPNEDNELWEEWHPYTKWVEYFQRYPDLNDRDKIIDDDCLDYMLETYTKALAASPNATVSFGWDHDWILKDLPTGEKIDLVNIDHHDDIFSGCFGASPEEEIMSLKTYDRVMEGNWGMWLQTQKRLKSFTWIGNKSSANIEHLPYAEKYIDNFKFFTKDEYDFGDYKFDQIFVCISPGYIPPLQWHMLGTFMTVYEEISGNVIDLKDFNKKYEIEKYYAQVTEFITKDTTIGMGSSSARFIY